MMKFYYEHENGDIFAYVVDRTELKFALRKVMAQIYKGAVGENLETAEKVADKIIDDLDDCEYLAEVYKDDLTEYFREDAFAYSSDESAEEIEKGEYNRVRNRVY